MQSLEKLLKLLEWLFRCGRKASTAKTFHKIRYISTESGTFFTESRGVEGSGLVKVNFTLRFRVGGRCLEGGLGCVCVCVEEVFRRSELGFTFSDGV